MKIFKKYKVIIIGFLAIVLLSMIFYAIDSYRATQNKNPIFTFIVWTVRDGRTKVSTGLGLGYKVRKWQDISTRRIDGIEVRGLLTGYTVTSFYKFLDFDDEDNNKLIFIPM